MKYSKAWEFIGDNIISILTIIIGVLVVILSRLNILPTSIIPEALLALLCMLATSELVERRKKIAKIEEKLDDVRELFIANSHGVKTITFQSNDEAILYQAKRLQEAKAFVDIAAIDRRRAGDTSARKHFEEARENVVLSDKVKVRYIGVLYGKNRLDFGREYVIKNKAKNFFAGYFKKPYNEIPLMSFIVIDKQEVITRYPFQFGQDTGYIAIQSPYIARLFLGYFERLWECSDKLRNNNDYQKLFEEIEENSVE